MNKRHLLGIGLFWWLVVSGAPRASSGTHEAEPFESLTLRFEVDLPPAFAADPRHRAWSGSLLGLRAEVALEAEVREGLASLYLVRGGDHVFDLAAPSEGRLGLRELALEVEGETLAEVLAAYPPGEYEVVGRTHAGSTVRGTAHLGADFPGFFRVLTPAPGDVLPPGDVTIAWSPSARAAGYVLEIEHEELGFALEQLLEPFQTSYAIPAQILRAGETYEYSLVVQGDTDNELEIEGLFTAPGKRVLPSKR